MGEWIVHVCVLFYYNVCYFAVVIVFFWYWIHILVHGQRNSRIANKNSSDSLIFNWLCMCYACNALSSKYKCKKAAWSRFRWNGFYSILFRFIFDKSWHRGFIYNIETIDKYSIKRVCVNVSKHINKPERTLKKSDSIWRAPGSKFNLAVRHSSTCTSQKGLAHKSSLHQIE